MDRRGVETRLAQFTLGAVCIYFPAETWVSWRHGLANPYYLVDLIAMVLMLWGAVHSLRARPRPSPGLLAAGYAWASANGWRATFDRVSELRSGGALDHGAAEAWVVGAATGVGMVCLVVALALVARQARD